MFVEQKVVEFIDARAFEFGYITGISLFAITAVVLIALVDNFYNRNKFNT